MADNVNFDNLTGEQWEIIMKELVKSFDEMKPTERIETALYYSRLEVKQREAGEPEENVAAIHEMADMYWRLLGARYAFNHGYEPSEDPKEILRKRLGK